MSAPGATLSSVNTTSPLRSTTIWSMAVKVWLVKVSVGFFQVREAESEPSVAGTAFRLVGAAAVAEFILHFHAVATAGIRQTDDFRAWRELCLENTVFQCQTRDNRPLGCIESPMLQGVNDGRRGLVLGDDVCQAFVEMVFAVCIVNCQCRIYKPLVAEFIPSLHIVCAANGAAGRVEYLDAVKILYCGDFIGGQAAPVWMGAEHGGTSRFGCVNRRLGVVFRRIGEILWHTKDKEMPWNASRSVGVHFYPRDERHASTVKRRDWIGCTVVGECEYVKVLFEIKGDDFLWVVFTV